MKMLEIIQVQLTGENGDWDEFDFDLLDVPSGDEEPWLGDNSQIAQVTDEKFEELKTLSEAAAKLRNELYTLHHDGAGSMESFNEGADA